jgi:hypothetical protein
MEQNEGGFQKHKRARCEIKSVIARTADTFRPNIWYISSWLTQFIRVRKLCRLNEYLKAGSRFHDWEN